MIVDMREIVGILDENLRLYKEGKNPKNIFFLAYDDGPIKAKIKQWFLDHNIKIIGGPKPALVKGENERGFIKNIKPSIWVIDSEYQKSMDQPFVFYYLMLDSVYSSSEYPFIASLIGNREVKNGPDQVFDMRNRMFTVATGDRPYNDEQINLPKELLSLFDIYEVGWSLQNQMKSAYQQLMGDIERSKNNGETYEYLVKRAPYLKRLIDTGFDIPDTSEITFVDDLFELIYMCSKDISFEDFVKTILRDYRQYSNEKIYSTESKVNEDKQKIAKWLEGLL